LLKSVLRVPFLDKMNVSDALGFDYIGSCPHPLNLIRRCLSRIWQHLPDSLKNLSVGRAYGRYLHHLICRYSKRSQNHSTFFMRNRPEMELMCRLLGEKAHGARVAISVLACSKGAEVYSILWSIRRARPDLRVSLQAVDISQEIIDFAKAGAYSLKDPASLKALDHSGTSEDENLIWNTCRDQGHNQGESIFQRLNKSEMNMMFDREGDQAKVKSWLKEGITWRVGDASARVPISALRTQDVVVANRFLCHMEPAAAERCLRNIAGLVKPGGYIFVSGVDLDIRTKVAKAMEWKPVSDLMREVHEGDISLTTGWPLGWWGLEPFCEDHPDWRFRYASVFRVGETPLGISRKFHPERTGVHDSENKRQFARSAR
jgi:chemotaxis methyl-accepting protein methylase